MAPFSECEQLNNFGNVNTDGTVNNNNANYSLGFAPGFYIDTGQTE